MTLTDKEVDALNWWITWSKDDMERRIDYSKEMERSGEVERGYYQRQLVLFHTVFDLVKKINN